MLYKNNHLYANRWKALKFFGHFVFKTRYFNFLNYFTVNLLSILNTARLPRFITLINVIMTTVFAVYLSNCHIFL